jgi:hypothetical protein
MLQSSLQALPDDLSIQNDQYPQRWASDVQSTLVFLGSIPEELRHHGLAEGHGLWMNDSGDS